MSEIEFLRASSLRVPGELEPRLLAILRHLAEKDQPELELEAESIRFETRATEDDLQTLSRLNLLDRGRRVETYRLSLLGYLQLDESAGLLKELEKFVRSLADQYQPGAKPLSASEILRDTGVSPERWPYLRPLVRDLHIGVDAEDRVVPSARLSAGATLESAIRDAYKSAFHRQDDRMRRKVRWGSLPFRFRMRFVEIRGFRAVRDLTLPLHPLTVLVGPNGVGKSTVLDAIAFVSRAVRFGLEAALRDYRGWASIRTRGQDSDVDITVGFALDYPSGDSVDGKYGIKLRPLAGEPVVEMEALVLDEESGPRALVEAKRGRVIVERPDGKRATFYGSPAALALVEQVDKDVAPLADAVRDALSRVVLIDYDPVLEREKESGLYWERPWQRASLAVERVLDPVLADDVTAKKLEARLRELVPSIREVHRTLEADVPELRFDEANAKGFRITELSAGARQLVLLAALQVQPEPPSVLLLEEPDGRVHPSALSALAELLRSIARKSTVLVTTHSPRFIARLDASTEVLALERTDSGVRAEPLGAMLRSKGWRSEMGSAAEAFERWGGERSE